MNHLYKIAEKNIYLYQQHKRDVEAYEASCIDRQSAPSDDGIRGAYKSDPTARGGLKLADRPKHIQILMDWVWAIETAWQDLLIHAPAKARLMEVYYGLECGGRPKHKATSTRYRLEAELAISSATFYNYKNDVVSSVIYAAIQCGVLTPYKDKALA